MRTSNEAKWGNGPEAGRLNLTGQLDLSRSKRRCGNESKSRGWSSLITTIIDTDSTPTWTTYEAHSPDLKRMSSAGWERANAEETSQDLVDARRTSVHRARFHNQNLVSRRAAAAKKEEMDPKPRTKTVEQALRQLRRDRTGSLPRHLRQNWSSAG